MDRTQPQARAGALFTDEECVRQPSYEAIKELKALTAELQSQHRVENCPVVFRLIACSGLNHLSGQGYNGLYGLAVQECNELPCPTSQRCSEFYRPSHNSVLQ